MTQSHSFLWLSNNPTIHMYHIFFIYSSVNGQLSWFQLLNSSKNQILILMIFLTVFNFTDFCSNFYYFFSSAYFGFNKLFFSLSLFLVSKNGNLDINFSTFFFSNIYIHCFKFYLSTAFIASQTSVNNIFVLI